MTDYSKVDYWEDRYSKNPQLFEWYQIYYTIAKSIENLPISKNDRVLHVGAGSSKLGEHMFNDGFRNIIEIDYSQTVSKIMNERYQEIGLPVKFMDVVDMKEINANEFNLVIDKGTLDSILCGENSIPIGVKMLKEIYRILANRGIFVCVSYAEKSRRDSIFNNFNWEVDVIKVPKPTAIMKSDIDPGVEEDSKNYHYVYVMKKNESIKIS